MLIKCERKNVLILIAYCNSVQIFAEVTLLNHLSQYYVSIAMQNQTNVCYALHKFYSICSTILTKWFCYVDCISKGNIVCFVNCHVNDFVTFTAKKKTIECCLVFELSNL